MQKIDLELLNNTLILVQKEKTYTLQILKNLQIIEAKKLFVELGLASLHGYCVEILGYSSSEAYLRISAMRVMREFSFVEEKITTGQLSLTTVGEMQLALVKKEKSESVKVSKEIKVELLKALENKSTRTAQKIVKEKLDLKDIMVTSDFKFKTTTIEKLKKLSAKMNVENLDELLLLLIKEKEDRLLEAKQNGLANLSSTAASAPACPISRPLVAHNATKSTTRYIPLKVKRAVFIRANYQCERCGNRKNLNVDHCHPFARGGLTTLSNLRVLCSPCNQRERVKNFGALKI